MKTTLLFGCILLSFQLSGALPQKLVLDLATDAGIIQSLPIPAGEYELIIKNLLPREARNYEITIDIQSEMFPLLPDPSSLLEGKKEDNCPDLKTPLDALKAVTEEAQIPGLRKTLEDVFRDAKDNCPEYNETLSLLSELDLNYKPFDLYKGQVLTVTVKRIKKDGKEQIWKITFKTPSRGQWLTTYSFNFIPKILSEQESFFAKSSGVDMFTITKEQNQDWLDFAPAIMFVWLKSKASKNAMVGGFSGGLGLNLEKPMAFIGYSLIYNQNICLNFGGAFHAVKKLDGKYKENEVIKENLTPQQLTIEPYRINPFIGISFRFDKNPFKFNKPNDTSGENNPEN